MAKITGMIEKINKKTGEGNRGPWTLYGYLLKGQWYSTFKDWDASEGMTVTIEYEEDREGHKNIKNVELNQDTFKGNTTSTTTVSGGNTVSNGTSIVRQNALRHADNLITCIDLTKLNEAQMLKRYFALAEMVEEWINRPIGLSFNEENDPEEEDVE